MSENIHLSQIFRKLRNVHRSKSVSRKGRAWERGKRGADPAEGTLRVVAVPLAQGNQSKLKQDRRQEEISRRRN